MVLDTTANRVYTELATQDPNYTLILASHPGKECFEHVGEVDGQLLPHGLLTLSLTGTESEGDPQKMTCGELLEGVNAKMKALGSDQVFFLGNRDDLVFAEEDTSLNVLDLMDRRNFAGLTEHYLRRNYSRFHRYSRSRFSGAFYSFGCAFLEEGYLEEAIEALESAQAMAKAAGPQGSLLAEIAFALGKAHLLKGSDPQAWQEFQLYASLKTRSRAAGELLQAMDTLVGSRRFALLVGIESYQADEISPAIGAQ